jgi:hypothetical protein
MVLLQIINGQVGSLEGNGAEFGVGGLEVLRF